MPAIALVRRRSGGPTPANLIHAPTLFSFGVKRVSLGGRLARAALSMLERAGRELLKSASLSFLDGSISYRDSQQRFGS